MNVKKIKRKCDVRGCGNTDSFCISRSRELGGSVIICKRCLSEALEELSPPTEAETTPADIEEQEADGDKVFKCEKCGKEYKSAAGLKKHKCGGEAQ